MGIKEKELEALVLNLLDTSSEIQRKIRAICSLPQESAVTQKPIAPQVAEPRPGFLEKHKISTLEATIEQLKNQLAQCRSENKQYVSQIEEYRIRNARLDSKCRELETDLSRSESKQENLLSELETSKRQIDVSKQQLRDYKLEIDRLKRSEQSLKSELAKADDNFRILKDRFSKPVILLGRYRSLSGSVRTGLSDIICDKDEVLFIASCSTPEHLKAIWTYTKKLAGSNGDMTDVEVLKDIFDYSFEVFNSSLREPMYVRDSVEVGYSFDDDRYDRCAGSSTSGKITQVILKGYRSVNTGTIICRSFVRV